MTNAQRKCSYCETPGHNRRTCELMREHVAIFRVMNSKYVKLVVNDLVNMGASRGALVEYVQAIDGQEKVTAMGLITDFQWDQLFFRKPGRRWIQVHILGDPNIEHGSYQYAANAPWKIKYPWRIRFAHHELRREWCSDSRAFKYMPELKQVSSADYDKLVSSTHIGGYWRVASPVDATHSKLLNTKRARESVDGGANVEEWFSSINHHGGDKECRTVRTEEWI